MLPTLVATYATFMVLAQLEKFKKALPPKVAFFGKLNYIYRNMKIGSLRIFTKSILATLKRELFA